MPFAKGNGNIVSNLLIAFNKAKFDCFQLDKTISDFANDKEYHHAICFEFYNKKINRTFEEFKNKFFEKVFDDCHLDETGHCPIQLSAGYSIDEGELNEYWEFCIYTYNLTGKKLEEFIANQFEFITTVLNQINLLTNNKINQQQNSKKGF